MIEFKKLICIYFLRVKVLITIVNFFHQMLRIIEVSINLFLENEAILNLEFLMYCLILRIQF